MKKRKKDLFRVKHELMDAMTKMTEVHRSAGVLIAALQALGLNDTKDQYKIMPLLRAIDKFQLNTYKKIREESLK